MKERNYIYLGIYVFRPCQGKQIELRVTTKRYAEYQGAYCKLYYASKS